MSSSLIGRTNKDHPYGWSFYFVHFVKAGAGLWAFFRATIEKYSLTMSFTAALSLAIIEPESGAALNTEKEHYQMKLQLGKNLKRLRRERDITQEELAEVLGVSFQSISRWELGVCYPDMNLLPAIASFFHVTVDALLGIDDAVERQKVAQYLSRFQESLSRGDVVACIAVAREGVAEFPNDYALLNKLMYALFLSGDEDGNIPDWQENRHRNDAEITALGERIMKYCPDQDIRLEATARLAFHHCEMGRKAQGREIYESLPSWEFSRQNQIWWALEGEERMENCRERIRAGYDMICAGLYNLGYERLLPDAELAKAYQKRFELDSWLYDGKRIPYRFPQTRCQYARVLARLGKSGEALAQLTTAAVEAEAFDNRPGSWETGSFLLGKCEKKRTDFETGDSRPCRAVMREKWMQHPDFDGIRNTLEFRLIEEQLAR